MVVSGERVNVFIIRCWSYQRFSPGFILCVLKCQLSAFNSMVMIVVTIEFNGLS